MASPPRRLPRWPAVPARRAPRRVALAPESSHWGQRGASATSAAARRAWRRIVVPHRSACGGAAMDDILSQGGDREPSRWPRRLAVIGAPILVAVASIVYLSLARHPPSPAAAA